MRRFSGAGIIFFLIVVFIVGGVVWKDQLIGGINKATNWNLCSEADAVRTENALLKDQLANSIPSQGIIGGVSDRIIAYVYSSYPFNNQNLLTINAGIDRGVKALMPATIGGRILVGQVTKTFKTHSAVRTIFSPDWQLPVRIGAQKIPGLLIGGPTVRVMMIANDKKIEVGDTVIAASKELPYGLLVGSVDSVKADTAAGIFQEVMVRVDYILNDLTELTVMLWTPD